MLNYEEEQRYQEWLKQPRTEEDYAEAFLVCQVGSVQLFELDPDADAFQVRYIADGKQHKSGVLGYYEADAAFLRRVEEECR